MGVIGLFPTSPPALLDASHVVVDKVLWRRGPRHLHCATPSHEKLLSPMIRSCTSCAHTHPVSHEGLRELHFDSSALQHSGLRLP